MRSACLRNARSPASVTSPLLPFLAPRVFADAQRHAQYHDAGSLEQQEEKSGSAGRTVLACDSKRRAALGSRYADIFTFTRQHLRSYSTGRSGDTLHQRKAGEPDRRIIRRLKSATKSTHGTGKKDVTVSQGRRLRHLNELHKSFKAYRAYEMWNFRHMPKRLDGRYRSLVRRILAHSSPTARVLNLHQPLSLLSTLDINMAFASLDRKVYDRLNRRSHPITINHLPDCVAWSASVFSDGPATDTAQVWRNWIAFDTETRERYWVHLLIYLLENAPQQAQSFLQALTHAPCVQSLDLVIITDAYEHLARGYLNKSWRSATKHAQFQESKAQIIPAFYHTFREHLAPHVRICSQDLLFCVAKLAGVDELRRMLDLMKESGTWVNNDVLLHYTNTFAKAGDFRQALSCLQMIVDRARSPETRVHLVNKEKFRWSCALTLHGTMMDRENYHETTDVVATLVGFGVKLDILLYNIIIHNSMKAGDYDTAFKVYNTLAENGLKPDMITFSTLLHGCTTADDPSKFKDFAKYCAETARETKDPWLATDYLYYEYIRLRRGLQDPEHLGEGSQQLLRTYQAFFDPRPLEPLWAINSAPSRVKTILTESCFLVPPPMALYIMLQEEIRKASSAGKSRAWKLYQKFTELVETKHDPMLSNLAKEPGIWNAFLLSFCRGQQFEYASQIVREMVDYGTKPNVYTWNIFMQGFFKTQQLNAAERVYEIMRSRGIEPDQFSYEVMLRGYARAQSVSKVGEVLEHVDQEVQMDPRLLRELAKIHDQRRVLFEMEKARIRREQWKQTEATAKEQREKMKWAPPRFTPLIQPKEESVDEKGGLVIKPLLDRSSLGLRFASAMKK